MNKQPSYRAGSTLKPSAEPAFYSIRCSDSTGKWCDSYDNIPVLPKSDDYSEVMYTNGSTSKKIYVKYDSDKELYLIKGLSKANGGSMPYIRFFKSADTSKITDRVNAITGTLYKTADSGTPVHTAAGSFNYDSYEPTHVVEADWPPIDLTGYASAPSSNEVVFASDKDNFGDNDNGALVTTYHVKNSSTTGWQVLKNGDNYWVELSSSDVTRFKKSSSTFYIAYATNNSRTSIPTLAAKGELNSNYKTGMSSAGQQGRIFSGESDNRQP